MRAISRFSVGEKVVEDELQPLLDFYQRDKSDGIARYRALFITIQQAEEKIHADFFREYSGRVFDTSQWPEQKERIEKLKDEYLNTDDKFSKPFRSFFENRLPKILGRLANTDSWIPPFVKELTALTCYHMFAEGVVAESAYFGFFKALKNDNGEILPTILKGIDMIKKHESTHIAYGVIRLRELIEGSLAKRIGMSALFAASCASNLPSVIGIVAAVHREHPGEFPFDLDRNELQRNGIRHFISRLRGVLGKREPRED